MKRTKQKPPADWIPPHARLPDSIEAIEAGTPERQAEPQDNAQPGRLARLLALPGVTTAADMATKLRRRVIA